MERDEVFKEHYSKPSDFKFSSKVAGVFDDMVNRSVPYYEEIQRMIAELAADHVAENSKIYDLGCSTGTTMIHSRSKGMRKRRSASTSACTSARRRSFTC